MTKFNHLVPTLHHVDRTLLLPPWTVIHTAINRVPASSHDFITVTRWSCQGELLKTKQHISISSHVLHFLSFLWTAVHLGAILGAARSAHISHPAYLALNPYQWLAKTVSHQMASCIVSLWSRESLCKLMKILIIKQVVDSIYDGRGSQAADTRIHWLVGAYCIKFISTVTWSPCLTCEWRVMGLAGEWKHASSDKLSIRWLACLFPQRHGRKVYYHM